MPLILRILILSFIFLSVPQSIFAGEAEDLYEVGAKYLDEGRTDFAFLKFEKLVKDYPHSKYAEEAQHRIIIYLDKLNSKETTLKEIRKYLELYPDGKNLEKVKAMQSGIIKEKLLAKADKVFAASSWQACIDTYQKLLLLDEQNTAYQEKKSACEASLKAEEDLLKASEEEKDIISSVAEQLGMTVEEMEKTYEEFWAIP